MVTRRAEPIWVESRKRWQVNVQRDGMRRTFTSSISGHKGKREAEQKADRWLMSKGTNQRFGFAWEEFIKRATEKCAKTTRTNYMSLGKRHIMPVIGNKKLEQITPADWERCVDHAVNEGLAQSTCERVRSVIQMFCNYCYKNRWEIDLPRAGEIEVEGGKTMRPRRALTPEEMAALFSDDLTPHYLHMWRFMALTGLRCGEAMGLQRADIAGNRATINRAISEKNEVTEGKTENAKRAVALSKHALKVLADQAAYIRSLGVISPWVFPDEDGDASCYYPMYKKWKAYARKKNIGCTMHELRHTFISVSKKDMPLALLKAQVGHSVAMDTYKNYGHEVQGEIDATAGIIDQSFDSVYQNVYSTK